MTSHLKKGVQPSPKILYLSNTFQTMNNFHHNVGINNMEWLLSVFLLRLPPKYKDDKFCKYTKGSTVNVWNLTNSTKQEREGLFQWRTYSSEF